MKLNIVTETEKQRWSLRYDAENLAEWMPSAVITEKPDPEADVNMFINYALYEPVDTVTTAMFTHLEKEGKWVDVFFEVADAVDWCFAMCKNTLRRLPKWKSSIMTVWPCPQYYRDNLTIGICGRDYKSGRKRMHWVDELRAIPGVVVKTTDGNVAREDMPAYYDGLDYLVVISENEGGPKPVVEALARGVPIIAPDVGYSWDFPVLRYETKEQMLDIVQRLIVPHDAWKETARQVAEVNRRLINGS